MLLCRHIGLRGKKTFRGRGGGGGLGIFARIIPSVASVANSVSGAGRGGGGGGGGIGHCILSCPEEQNHYIIILWNIRSYILLTSRKSNDQIYCPNVGTN